MQNNKGFTLVELLIVISIVGILIVATISALSGKQKTIDSYTNDEYDSDCEYGIKRYEYYPTGSIKYVECLENH